MFAVTSLKLAVDCPECKLAVPVNAVVPRALCTHCSAAIPLDWGHLLDLGNPKVHALDRSLALAPGAKDTGAFASIHLEVARAELRCAACSAALDPADFAARGEGVAAAHCPACGATVAIRPAPPELRASYPAARLVAHEQGAVDTIADAPQKSALMFACMKCGASLALDGASRTVACAYCHGENYLPDGVWLRLHPPRRSTVFFVVTEPDEGHVHAMRYRFAEDGHAEARRDAARPELPVGVQKGLAQVDSEDVQTALAKNPRTAAEAIAILATSEYRAVRALAARHPNAPAGVADVIARALETRARGVVYGEPVLHDECAREIALDAHVLPATLAYLASSREHSVREAVARNPRTPPAALAALARDARREVRDALARNEALPGALAAALAGDAEARTRKCVAERADLAVEVAMRLARDADRDVRRSLASNPATPDAVLKALVESGDDDVKTHARQNRNYVRRWWEIF